MDVDIKQYQFCLDVLGEIKEERAQSNKDFAEEVKPGRAGGL